MWQRECYARAPSSGRARLSSLRAHCSVTARPGLNRGPRKQGSADRGLIPTGVDREQRLRDEILFVVYLVIFYSTPCLDGVFFSHILLNLFGKYYSMLTVALAIAIILTSRTTPHSAMYHVSLLCFCTFRLHDKSQLQILQNPYCIAVCIRFQDEEAGFQMPTIKL